jgi:NFU1 iron-sulfur cluster scaffold homolog, mitochondrial
MNFSKAISFLLKRFHSVKVVSEATPNPRTLLFVAKNEKLDSKFAKPVGFDQSMLSMENFGKSKMILSLPGVERVLFFSPHSASVSFSSEAFLKSDELENQVKAILEGEDDVVHSENASSSADASSSNVSILAQIEDILDGRVKPSIQADGGDVELVSYDEMTKTVHVRLRGSCVGCPSSELTLKQGIEKTLKFYLPDIVHSIHCEDQEQDIVDFTTGHVKQSPLIKHEHKGRQITAYERAKLINEMPFVSLFAAKPVDDKMKEKVQFVSEISIEKQRISSDPELMVQIKCPDCGCAKAIEALDSLLLNQPGKKNTTSTDTTAAAAAVICPVCAVILRTK